MIVRSVESGSLTTITLCGELDLASVHKLISALALAERSAASRIVLDLTAVDFIDARGLRALVQAANRSRVDGDRLRIRKSPGVVTRVIDLTSLGERLPLVA
jgi:anti-sigma B factor antagonist